MSQISKDTESISFPEIRVVEASAGSGKTYALTQRYVRLVLGMAASAEMPIRTILALTFTNKAAFEMKGRILSLLKRIAFQRLSDQEAREILGPLALSPVEAARLAFRVMETVIRHYHFFQVQTIDKFINALLVGCAFKIGLTARFRIKTDVEEIIRYSLDILLEQAPRDPGVMAGFERFLHHYLYLENRMGWFPKEDILGVVMALFDQHNTYAERLRPSGVDAVEIIKRKRRVVHQTRLLAECLPEAAKVTFRRGITRFLEAVGEGFDIDQLTSSFYKEEIPLRKGAEASSEADRLWRGIREDLRWIATHEARSLFDPYIELFHQVTHVFYRVSAREDCLFLSELNRKVRALFEDERLTVEEIYYRLASRFRHYLLDEFQDTSRLQWQNLEPMIEEALSVGGSLFYVGDRKQAIYRFRGGDVRLFDEAPANLLSCAPRTDYLTTNWRSRRAIVTFNNKVFSMENLRRFIRQKQQRLKEQAVVFDGEDLRWLRRVFGHARQTCEASREGCVRMSLVEAKNRQERDREVRERLLRLVEELKTRHRPGDIAVLTRGNQEVELITNWLLEAGWQVVSERTSNIRNSSLIQEIVAFLRFLETPGDNQAFAKVILGELFGRASGLSSRERHDFVFACRDILAKQKDEALYIHFRQRYPDTWKDLVDDFFRYAGWSPLYELVISLYGRWRCLERFSDYQGFFMHFLELIRKQEEEFLDISSFLRFFDRLQGEDLYVPLIAPEAVRVLTIHKAKGLEFSVVVIPFLEMRVQAGSRGGDQAPAYVTCRRDGAMELWRIKKSYRLLSAEAGRIYDKEYKEAFLDELNNVYVALTRPRKELHAFIPRKAGNAVNLVPLLIPSEAFYLGEPDQDPSAEPPTGSSARFLSVSSYGDGMRYLREEFGAKETASARPERLMGQAVHLVLSYIEDITGQDIAAITEEAVRQARGMMRDPVCWATCRSKVEAFLRRSETMPFFQCRGKEVRTEEEVVDAFGRQRRVDRLIIEPRQVTIVEFKTGPDKDGAHQRQVEDYRTLLRQMYPGRQVVGRVLYI